MQMASSGQPRVQAIAMQKLANLEFYHNVIETAQKNLETVS
ncbi:MAG: hypothetical protein RJA42_1555, partial [Bacteroidota bacterium]